MSTHGDYPPAKPGWQKEPATEKQLKRLFVVADKHGYSDTDIQNFLREKFQIDTVAKLTKSQIQALFVLIEKKSA